MSERADYSEAWGFMPEFLPENKKGRGLVVSEGRMLEYQTALPADGENETERNKAILQKLDAISGKNVGLAAAERVKVIPFNISSVFGGGVYTVGSSDGYSPPEQVFGLSE